MDNSIAFDDNPHITKNKYKYRGQFIYILLKAQLGRSIMVNNKTPKNILGEPLQPCCNKIKTGYFRDGFCRTNEQDFGRHVVCAKVTAEFLTYTKAQGNDLSTPHPEWQFPGLKPGDCWCLCALRWKEAKEAGYAPPIVLAATNIKALEYIVLEDLQNNT